MAKLADFLVAEGVVEDISHEGLRELLHAEGVSFQSVKTWKQSPDPDYAAKKARIDHLYAVADGGAAPAPASGTSAEAAPASAAAPDSLYPPQVRIAIICDNYSPHLTTRKDKRVGNWATANNTEIACVPTNSSWMNRIPVNRPSARRHARTA